MSTNKKIDIICIAAAVFALALTALLAGARIFGVVPVATEAAGSDFFTANDLNRDWDPSAATKITLSDSGSAVSGNGAYVYDGDVYIVYAGHYVLSGELTDGSIIVNAGKSDKIWIALDGVTLHCEDGAAIRIEQADKVFLTLQDGAENLLSSGAQYSPENMTSGVDGVIYSRDDLTVNGTGSLVVNAAYYHGIVCNDDLAVTGGNITINAVQDGIHANDSVRICDSAISISAGDDGITVSNDDETAFLYIASGSITVSSCYEGLEAVAVTIAGGTVRIMPTDDGINACGSGANSVIRITGGDITILNPSGRDADGLDSNGSIYIEGGNVFVSVSDTGSNSAIDYGTENGGECIVSGGTVIACGGSMMAEGFDPNSPQGFVMYDTRAAAGTAISLEDSSGRELLSAEIPYGFSSVVLSAPELQVGDTCTLSVGDAREQITIDNTSSGSGFSFGFGSGPGFHSDFGSDFGSGFGVPGDPSGQMPDPGDRPDSEAWPGRQEMPDSEGWPGRQEMPDGKGWPGRQGMPDGEAWPGKQEMPDGEAWPGGQEIREVGGRASAPSASLSYDALLLLGISALALLAGLLTAVKIRH